MTTSPVVVMRWMWSIRTTRDSNHTAKLNARGLEKMDIWPTLHERLHPGAETCAGREDVLPVNLLCVIVPARYPAKQAA